MQFCYQKTKSISAIPIVLIEKSNFPSWLKKQSAWVRRWMKQVDFIAEIYHHCLMMDRSGKIERVFVIVSSVDDLWAVSDLSLKLPQHTYYIENKLTAKQLYSLAIGWGLGAYQFTQYKKPKRKPAKLFLPGIVDAEALGIIISGVYMTRDLINLPTDDLGPSEFSAFVFELSQTFGAGFSEIIGEALLDEGYRAIHAVGRGSDDAPRLLDITCGDKHYPKVTLVGKGVCFDSGGLNLKPTQHMLHMKKDMGGAAHVLGLAQMVMMAKLPIRLRVLIPLVENVVSGNAYHPGDVITMRNGKTVEITNTDAEGRLILADALVEASNETPDLLIDFATLTGAARVALGTEIVSMFCNDDELSESLTAVAKEVQDSVWRMPLHLAYLESLKSRVAELSNSSSESYGGAIVAALFLQSFIASHTPWVHFDLMAMNIKTRPGIPEGGEAQMLRAMFEYLQKRYPTIPS